jgi:D-tyrosyl-tRNA(Tyr) deacylase
MSEIEALPAHKCVSAIIQRVLSASVTVDKEVVSAIGRGVLVFAAVAPGDTEKEMNAMAAKVVKMKMWDDDAGGKVGRHTAGVRVWVGFDTRTPEG